MSKLGDLEANDISTCREYFPWHLNRFWVVNATRCRCVNLIQSEVVIIPMVPMSSIEGSAGSYLGVSRFLEVEPFDGGRERGEIPCIYVD